MNNNPTEERMHNQNEENPDESGKGISAAIAVLGLWMILQVFLFETVDTQFWNDIIVGALLVAVGAYNYSRQSNEKVGSIASASVAALLGLWLIATPFILGADTGLTETTNDYAFWNDIIVGLLAFGLGAYSAYEIREDRQEAMDRRTVS